MWVPAPDTTEESILRLVDPAFAAFFRGMEDAFGAAGSVSVRVIDTQSQYVDMVALDPSAVDRRAATIAEWSRRGWWRWPSRPSPACRA